MKVLPARLIEVGALLPMLHVPAGKVTVAVAGPQGEQWAREALRWRDVEKLLTLQDLDIKDRRIQRVPKLEDRSVDLLLLSPEQAPKPWLHALRPDAVLSTLTVEPEKARILRGGLLADLGNALPWRDHLPDPIYGVLAKNGPGKLSRTRQVPGAAVHLSRQFLPCLFTFAKDEMAVLFGPPSAEKAAPR